MSEEKVALVEIYDEEEDVKLEATAPEPDQRPYDNTISDIKGLQPILAPAVKRRDRIRQQAVASIQNVFKVDGTNHTMDVQGVKIDARDYTLTEQKDALLQRQTLLEPIKGTIIVRDKKTGKIVDKSKRTLAHLPWMTNRHTFLVDGNEYGLANQLRIKPGVYTRQRSNGELEAAFNLGRGKNFRMSMDPQKGVFHLGYDSTKIVLYPVLKALGISDAELERAWGSKLAEVNRSAAKNQRAQVRKLYEKIVYPSRQKPGATTAQMAEAIAEAYTRTVLDPSVTRRTLGSKYTAVNPQALVSASKKLLGVFKGDLDEDDRDSLEFKTLHTPDTFFKERIEKEAAPTLLWKMRSKLNRSTAPQISKIVPSAPFSKSLRSLITTSQIAHTPSQINPVEVIDMAGKVTSLGEGGIGSVRAVPDTTREQHSSHLGILDPIRTPESETVGVDVRASIYAAVDERGNPHALMRDVRKDKLRYVPVTELQNKTVAFSGTDLKKRKVPALVGNKMRDVDSKSVDYMVPTAASMFSPATGLVPMINGQQGNRNIMGAKMQTQAVPLLHRENPLVQTASDIKGESMESVLAKWHLPKSPFSGTVTSIDKKKGKVFIKAKASGKSVGVDFAQNFPFASKTGLTHFLSVKPGDKVKKDQVLGNSNFTKDGKLALGTNLRTAYLAYNGLNTNDAVVISSSASKKLTSEHVYKEVQRINDTTTVSKAMHRKYFGTKVDPREYAKLGEDGLPKVGSMINAGELITAAVEERKLSSDDALLGRLNKSLVKPYRDASLTWEHTHPGEVLEVVKTPKYITIVMKTRESMGIGDKLSGRYGNKGVVSTILPDDQMPQGEDGNPLDVLLTSAGVVSRINPSQIVETAVAKVARKTGKPLILETFPRHDRVKWAKGLLKQHGIKDKETVFDPKTGRKIPGIMVGEQYTFKLFKSTDTNFSTRAVGPYDSNEQPTKGGQAGAKGIGRMEFNALVAHGAKNLIRETATVKGTRNDEFWKRVQMGLPEAKGGSSFAFKKFGSMLTGAGINFQKRGDQFSVTPLTDRDIDALAQTTVKQPGVVKVRTTKTAVNVVPEKGGLFDPATTGGLRGTKWAKIELAEPVVNPVFEKPARELLGMTEKEFSDVLYGEGAATIKKRLNKLDLDKLRSNLQANVRRKMDSTSKSAMDSVDRDVRRLKYIRALRKEKLKPGDAYVLSKVPVVPPVMRPVTSGGSGQVLVSDPNFLYKDLLVVNNAIKDTPAEIRAIEDPAKARKELQGAVRAIFGTAPPVNDKTKARGAVGFITQIAGQGSPKAGFFHSKLLTRQQDLSGRGTIAPDPSLGLDEIGIPVKMLWKQYSPFIVRRLVQKGYPVVEARKMVDEQTPAAKRELELEIKDRPVLVNRAPTLHRFGLVSAYAKPVSGKTIRLNPFAEEGLNADYDGDAVQIHVPATQAGLHDARDMTLSKLLFADGTKNTLMIRPQHEAVVGAYLATQKPKGAVKKFKSKAAAMAAYNRGEISMSTPVQIAGKKTPLT
jgi:DNA-directed RNA polymerase subunit beta